MSDRRHPALPGRLVVTLHPPPVNPQDCWFWLFLLPRDDRDAFTDSFHLVIVEVAPSGSWLTVWVMVVAVFCVPNSHKRGPNRVTAGQVTGSADGGQISSYLGWESEGPMGEGPWRVGAMWVCR